MNNVPNVSSKNHKLARIIANNNSDSFVKFLELFVKDHSNELLNVAIFFDNEKIINYLFNLKETIITLNGLETLEIALKKNNLEAIEYIIHKKDVIEYQERNKTDYIFEALAKHRDLRGIKMLINSNFPYSEKNILACYVKSISCDNLNLFAYL